MRHLVILALLWIGWCALHSLLIDRRVQITARRLSGRLGRAYRLFYVLFSILTLLPVLWYQLSLSERVILQGNPGLHLVQAALLIYGLLMFYLGARVYDLRAFLGISQLQEQAGSETRPGLRFHTDGILARVRHPWYSGGIALIWGFGRITDVFLLTRVLLTAYLVIGTLLEEQRLIAELGDKYRDYRRTVPMLVPWPRKARRPR